jgi:hypothetical protein
MDLRMNRGVEKVIVLYEDDRGRSSARTVYRRSKRRKKGTGPLRTLGRVVRGLVAGQQAAAKAYLDRHDESNRQKTDGWARDLSYNVYRATRRGLRKVRRVSGLPVIDLEVEG